MTSNRDLREQMDSDSVANAFASLVSGGKSGYKTVIEKKKIPPKCSNCGGAEMMVRSSVLNVEER